MIKELATEYVRLRGLRDESEKITSDLNTQIDAIEQQLFLAMGEEGMGSANYEDLGVKIIAQQRKFPRFKTSEKHRQEELFAWLDANGHGNVVQLGIHPATLKSTLKQLVDEGIPMPDYIETYVENGVTLRKI